MDAPTCLKCGSKDFMALEDSGPTYQSWRCIQCNMPKTQKNLLGKVLPFAVPALLLLGIELPHGGDSCGGGC